MVSKMVEVASLEFPFVAEMPKTKKRLLADFWDMFDTIKEITETEGNLIPVILTCKLLDISRTRVDQLCADGRLKRHEVEGHVFILGNSIVEFAKNDRRRVGRPPIVGDKSIFKNTPK